MENKSEEKMALVMEKKEEYTYHMWQKEGEGIRQYIHVFFHAGKWVKLKPNLLNLVGQTTDVYLCIETNDTSIESDGETRHLEQREPNFRGTWMEK